MRIFATFAIASALAFGTAPAALSAQDTEQQLAQPSEANLALARQIIDIGMPEETREIMFMGTMDQMTAQMRTATLRAYDLDDEGAIAVLDQWIADYIAQTKDLLRGHIPSLMEGMAASYATIFTQGELEDILAFVSTKSGQRFFELSSAVLAEPNFAAANQAYMNDSQAMMPSAMEDLIGRLQEYSAEQEAAADQTAS